MKSWIRPLAALVGTLCLMGPLQAAAPGPQNPDKAQSQIMREGRPLPDRYSSSYAAFDFT